MIGARLGPLPFLPPQVDKHIRRLDTDLARFEADLKEKQIESSDYDSSSSKGKKSEEGRGCEMRARSQREKRPTPARRERHCLDQEQRELNPSFCLCLPAYPFFLEGRTQKEKKAARARSKGKNSDEEAPKAAQKKLKLVRT